MCGLALAANKKGGAGQRVFDLYLKQKSRGQEGFGYLAIQNGVLVALERSKWEFEIKSKLIAEKSQLVIFHHRLPTSTENTVGTTHPIFVRHNELKYDYYVMHNGGVYNDEEMKKKHNELGYEYTTEFKEVTYAVHSDGRSEVLRTGKEEFNDSECLAIEAARFIEGLQPEMENRGGAAFFVVQMIKETEKVNAVFFAQNHGRQLGRRQKRGWTIVASEHGSEVPRMKLFKMDPKTFEITESDIKMHEGYKPSPYQGNLSLPGATSKPNPYGLVNAYYTREEAEESGAPLSEFSRGVRMHIDGVWKDMFIPDIFIGEHENRPLFRDEYYMVDLPDPIPDKSQTRLEELAMKYARKQHEFDYICEMYVNDKMEKETYTARRSNLELEMDKLEEEMSTLGIDTETVEETVQTAQDLVDFEYGRK